MGDSFWDRNGLTPARLSPYRSLLTYIVAAVSIQPLVGWLVGLSVYVCIYVCVKVRAILTRSGGRQPADSSCDVLGQGNQIPQFSASVEAHDIRIRLVGAGRLA